MEKLPHAKIPKILEGKLNSHEMKGIWQSLTPLQKNEWICFVTSPVKVETKQKRVERMLCDLGIGKRRPCCFGGCPHRKIT